jgi:hypothetical protein
MADIQEVGNFNTAPSSQTFRFALPKLLCQSKPIGGSLHGPLLILVAKTGQQLNAWRCCSRWYRPVHVLRETSRDFLTEEWPYFTTATKIHLNPHTDIGCVRLFRLGCYRASQLLYALGTALSRPSFWASSWYFRQIRLFEVRPTDLRST